MCLLSLHQSILRNWILLSLFLLNIKSLVLLHLLNAIIPPLASLINMSEARNVMLNQMLKIISKYLFLYSLYLLGSISMMVPSISSNQPIYFTIKKILNPEVLVSSYFKVCLRKNGILLECDK